ncbi:RING finger protein 121-like [Varroa jacobsoni]|uniref:RING-type domain-containing protein n=1 Tax=Varroa destructor TaxID=109461 RepID=A0A7M7KYC4_VARDE|nr:RING finger protein 121-like [Varroa destructor]XP_022705254.1 RING finger protein 121-like [Varroa jacobsoni]
MTCCQLLCALPAAAAVVLISGLFDVVGGHLHISVPQEYLDDPTKDISHLDDDTKLRIMHARYHEKHKGHDEMHFWMGVTLIVAVIVTQILIVFWKEWHYSSYRQFTMWGLWGIPCIVSIHSGYWRFVFVWTIFSAITGLIMRMAFRKPIARTTPRWVYKWFYAVHLQSVGLGVLGYMVLLSALLGFSPLFLMSLETAFGTGFLIFFYGTYYGVLGRDIAEVVTNKMAATIGYYTDSGVPYRTLDADMCAVCAQKILVTKNEDAVVEERYTLPCSHSFHEFCIRGWCVVGKKQTCPYCNEKVDLQRLFKNPWEKPHVIYGHFLDFIRYLLVWQPIILGASQGFNWYMGFE